MGTKNNPGKWDCYNRAHEDEPMFVLLGRDPCAPFVVTLWVKMRIMLNGDADADVVEEAGQCARKLEAWARNQGKGQQVDAALEAFEKILIELGDDLLKDQLQEMDDVLKCERANLDKVTRTMDLPETDAEKAK